MRSLLGVHILWTVLGPLVGTTIASGAELRCTKDQAICYLSTRDFTVGEDVAILNAADKTVAIGVIEAIKGSRRVIKIEKRMGPIHPTDRVALVEKDAGNPSTTVATVSSTHEAYEKPGDIVVGASGGIATVRSGEGLPAYLFDGYGEWRKWYGLRLVVGGIFVAASGKSTRTNGQEGIATSAMEINGLGVYPGVAYRFFESSPVSPRLEADLGAVYISGTVNGAAGDFDRAENNANMTNGVGLFGRLRASLQYQMSGGWSIEGGGSTSQIQQALTNGLFAGVSKALK